MKHTEQKIETLIQDTKGRNALELLLKTYENGKKVYFSRCRIEKTHLANNQQRLTQTLNTDDLDEARTLAHQRYAEITVRQESNQSIKVATVNQVIDRFFENTKHNYGPDEWTPIFTKDFEKHTGKKLSEISNIMERDSFFSPEEAITFGLIDKIVENRK